MRRLCIYLTYDKENMVDKYIRYMLDELRLCVEQLVVVCNEADAIRHRGVVEGHSDQVFYRNNIGFDAGGFKDALCSFVGWDRVSEYDELVLANDSMFGPFEKMEKIFSDMQEKQADFWGLTKLGACRNEGGYIPEHIQTFFYAIRSEMLHSREFKDYWEEMPYYETFDEVVKCHEIRFTPYFSGLGYKYAVLADTEANDSQNISNNYLQYGSICYELIKKRNFPFLKKQQMAYDMKNLQTQENIRQAIGYIQKSTDYDVDMIWQNIIRTMDVSDLYRNLHLRYIVGGERGEENVAALAIAVFASHRGAGEYLEEYLNGLDQICTVYVFSSDRDVFAEYEKTGWRNRLCDIQNCYGEIIKELCQYEYVCMIHDVDMTSEVRPSCTGKSYFYSIWENLIGSKSHVLEIAAQFKEDKYLGFLASPPVFFAHHFEQLGRGWNHEFEKVVGLVKRLKLNCRISYDKKPFVLPSAFWIRGTILQKLCQNAQLARDCLSYLPYLWIYIVQDSGYYSGIVESPDYAAMNEVNMQGYLESIGSDVRKYFGGFGDFSDFRKNLFRNVLESFCKGYEHIYIYGAGYLARQYQDLIPEAEAFIVSDGQEKSESFSGLRIVCLSEVDACEDVGIVVCVNEKNQKQILPLLEARGLKHYLCI